MSLELAIDLHYIPQLQTKVVGFTSWLWASSFFWVMGRDGFLMGGFFLAVVINDDEDFFCFLFFVFESGSSLIPKLMQDKIKVTRKVKINPKNQHLGVAWNQHQASKT